eukprot:3249874-Pyramimonas_sp.AAC.1
MVKRGAAIHLVSNFDRSVSKSVDRILAIEHSGRSIKVINFKREISGKKRGTGHRVSKGEGSQGWGAESTLAVVGTGGPVK